MIRADGKRMEKEWANALNSSPACDDFRQSEVGGLEEFCRCFHHISEHSTN
jgi:hypothetical protein